LTTGNPVYPISTKSARRVWPVSRACYLHGTWSYFRFVGGHCRPTLDFVYMLFLDYNHVNTLLTSPINISLNTWSTTYLIAIKQWILIFWNT
jgi:hypothetical protein